MSHNRVSAYIPVPSTTTATIASGDATGLSGIVDCRDGRAAHLVMPSSWTAADLTFQTSYDGTVFSNLYDAFGSEYIVKAAASRAIILPLVDFLGVTYIRVRSGTSAAPVTQSAARGIVVVLQP